MRILYHHRTLADGAEGVHIREMVDAFERLGHEVRVHALVGQRPSASEGRVTRLARLRQLLPDFAYEPMQFAHSLASTVPFSRELREFAPDFVYKRHARYDFGPLLACRKAGIPLILEVNSVYSGNWTQFEQVAFAGALRNVERWIFHNATRSIAVSRPLAAEILKLAPRANVLVMPNGVNPRRFRPQDSDGDVRRALDLHGRVVVGFVGILWKWHGLDLLLQALHALDNRDVHLLVVGDGEMRATLQQHASDLGIARQVTFTGRVAHDEVPRYVAAMDVTVLPAEHRSHASPMKIVEYMAMAKPVVAPRLPNIEDILTDGEEGLLFAPNDSSALARSLQRLILDPELRRTLGSRGRNKVDRHLNWDNNAQQVLALVTGQAASAGP